MQIKSTNALTVQVFMAGDKVAAEDCCAKFCDEVGLCVTVTPTSYIYTGGRENGFVVGLINYARFPSNQEAITEKAFRLAWLLMRELGQDSFTVQTPENSIFCSERKEDSDAS